MLQDTTIDPLNGHFFGSGSIDLSFAGLPADIDAPQTGSDMGVTFVLARATPYRFTGLLNVSTAEVFLFAFLDELAEHQRNRLWQFALFEEDPDDVVPIWLIQEVGILPAGRYQFGTFAGTFGPQFLDPGTAGWDVDFALATAVTPEPTSLLPVSIGLIGAAARWRRARTRPA